MPARPEDKIHRDILEYLRLVLPGAAINHAANEVGLSGKQAERIVGKAKAMGMRPGWPDLEVIYQGRALFFEVKAPEGRVSLVQRQTQADLAANGALCAVVRSIDDTRACLRTWGIQTREITA